MSALIGKASDCLYGRLHTQSLAQGANVWDFVSKRFEQPEQSAPVNRRAKQSRHEIMMLQDLGGH